MDINILNPPGIDQLGQCDVLSNGIQQKIKHIQKETLGQDIQKLPELHKQLSYNTNKIHHVNLQNEIQRIETEMNNAQVDYVQTIMKIQSIKNENIVLQNKELNDQMVE